MVLVCVNKNSHNSLKANIAFMLTCIVKHNIGIIFIRFSYLYNVVYPFISIDSIDFHQYNLY